jgi:hypothetical protein
MNAQSVIKIMTIKTSLVLIFLRKKITIEKLYSIKNLPNINLYYYHIQLYPYHYTKFIFKLLVFKYSIYFIQ